MNETTTDIQKVKPRRKVQSSSVTVQYIVPAATHTRRPPLSSHTFLDGILGRNPACILNYYIRRIWSLIKRNETPTCSPYGGRFFFFKGVFQPKFLHGPLHLLLLLRCRFSNLSCLLEFPSLRPFPPLGPFELDIDDEGRPKDSASFQF